MATWAAPVGQQKGKSLSTSIPTLQPVIYTIAPNQFVDDAPCCEDESIDEDLCAEDTRSQHGSIQNPEAKGLPETHPSTELRKKASDLKLELYSSVELKLESGLSVVAESPRTTNSLPYVSRYKKANLKQRASESHDVFLNTRKRPKKERQTILKTADRMVIHDNEIDLNNNGCVRFPCINDKIGPISTRLDAPMRQPIAKQNGSDNVLRLPEIDTNSIGRHHKMPDIGGENACTLLVSEYDDTPGRRSKSKYYGRKLGNICSSKKLLELLEYKEPLRMENCFNYYP